MTDTHYAIRKGVPFPTTHKVRKAINPPLSDMNVGDSFTFPPEDENRVRMAIYKLTADFPKTAFKVRGNAAWRTK